MSEDGGRVAARLARLSFRDGARAAELLSAPPLNWWDPAANRPVDDAAASVVAALGRCADPDAALATLADVIATPGGADLRAALESQSPLRARLLAVLGVSAELSAQLRTHPRDWEVLLGELDPAGVPAPARCRGGRRRRPTGHRHRRSPGERHRNRCGRSRCAMPTDARSWPSPGRDLVGDLDLQVVTELLADLAGHTLQAALAVAAAGLPADAAPCRLAIIAMGKTGSRELNYISDVDVVFVGEPATDAAGDDATAALATATRLAGETMRICRAAAWEVDANLRPEGKDGPLVRTLASHEAYYHRWASTWEFQALLKARPIAGDLELGRRYDEIISPLVWTAAERPGFVADVRSMRRRVLEHIPAGVGRARHQARPRRTARRRVRRPAAAARPRPRRRVAAGARDACRHWMPCARAATSAATTRSA